MKRLAILLLYSSFASKINSDDELTAVDDVMGSSGTLIASQNRIFEFKTESDDPEKYLLLTLRPNPTRPKSRRCSFDKFLFEVREGQNRQRVLKECDLNGIPERISVELPATVKIRWGGNVTSFAFSYFFVDSVDQGVTHLSCDHRFQSVPNAYTRWLQCPAGCVGVKSSPVIGGKLEQYGEQSSICRSAIHAGAIADEFGGLVRIEPQRNPLEIRRESFESIWSNSIESETGAPGQGFRILSDSSSRCTALSLAIADEQVTASSYLHKLVDPHVEGVEPVETLFNWVASHAVSKSASPWAPAVEDANPWIQITFDTLHFIERIETAGSTIQPFDFKPNTFFVQVRNDSSASWVAINQPRTGQPKIFDASGQPSRHHFYPSLVAKEIRIFPTSSDKYPVVALKVKLYGCRLDMDRAFQFGANSMVLIGVIVGLAIVALMLASVSLLLIRRSRNSKMTNFSKNNSLKGNIYSHQPNTDTIRNMKYVNYRNCNVRSEVEYSTPFVSPVHRNEPILRQNHEYSDIETLPLAATIQQRPDLLQMNKSRLDFDVSYDDHTYSTIG